MTAFWKSIAKARTVRALEHLSDHTLRDIGIERADIRTHVAKIYENE